MHSEVQQLVQQGRLPSALASNLENLQPESFCLHRNWGPGKVVVWDIIGDRMTIDFEGKPGHVMKLEFAAKQLEPLSAEHFLVARLTRPDELKALAHRDPAALVRHCVSSQGGSMHMDDFEATVSPLLAPGGFKSWWDSAKKQLKKDRSFVIPSRRTLPLEVHDESASAGDRLIKDITDARDIKARIAAAKVLAEDLSVLADAATDLPPVLSGLSNAARQAAGIRLPEAIELLVVRDQLAQTCGLDTPEPSLIELMRLHRAKLAEAIPAMPVVGQRIVYEAFREAFGDEALEEWLRHLRTAGARGVAEIARQLESANQGEALLSELRKGVSRRQMSIELYVWVCQEREGLPGPLFDVEFGHAMMLALEQVHGEAGSKRGLRLRDLLSSEGASIMPRLLRGSPVDETRHFARRILQSPVFDELSRRSLIGHIIKVCPEVQDLLTGAKRSASEEKLVVSWESLEERKRLLEEIVSVKIPGNKREIQIAREYGDLRENFEFKAAKQQQAVLNRQRTMLELEMKNARGTDFSNADTSAAGIGTIVDVRDTASGGTETFTILGAWDTDVERGILSYLTAAAQALIGHSVGEKVLIPTDEEGATEREVEITDIRAHASAAPKE